MFDGVLSSASIKDLNYSISNISNLTARNIIRGILNNDNKGDVTKALYKIKANCNIKQYKECINVIRGNELFKFNNYSRYFVDKCLLTNSHEEIGSLEEIFHNIEFNSKKLKVLLEKYGYLYKSLYQEDYDNSLLHINEIIDDHGVSIVLLKIIYSIKTKTLNQDDGNLKKELEEILKKIQISRVKKIDDAIKWISLSKDDYFNFYGKIKYERSEYYADWIIKSFLDPFPSDDHCYLKTLNAFFAFSLFDSLVYILNCERIELPFTLLLHESLKELRVEFEKWSEYHPITKSKELSANEYVDQFFFRGAFLLGELEWVFKYRLIHETFYRKDESGYYQRPPLQLMLITDYFSEVSSFEDLRLNHVDNYMINFERYNKKTSGQLENTTALIYLLEKIEGDISGFEEAFIKIMTYTHDVGEICPERILTCILNTSNNSDVSLIISSLLFIKHKTRKAEHVLRANLQEVILEDFNSDIIAMIVHFYEISPAVTEHFINLCDENFLSKLFGLTERPIDAISNRAEILEWYGITKQDQHYIERAKNLRTDIKISKEKGTIDDSRIYVDTTKYIQWLNDNKINKILNYLEMLDVSNSVEASNFKANWPKAKSGLTVIDSLASEVLGCYEEFCVNKLFGVASYLGRRIRHGTFKGTGLKDITDIQNLSKFNVLKANRIFSENYSSWIRNYTKMLDDLKNGNLHIHSKNKPNGFLKTELTTKSKILMADHLLRDLLNSYLKDPNGSHLPYIIVEYCWRFIEEDLSEIRKLLMEYKSKYGVFNILNHNFNGSLKRDYQDFASNINSVSAEKFRTISSWFKKPSTVSPTTDIVLLFKAVVSEVKGLINDYEPVVSVCDDQYEISGGKYFAIYDALYLIIHNAAKHGKRDGNLILEIKFDTNFKALNISVQSEFKDVGDFNVKTIEIEKKLVENNEDANDIDEKSGLKKLTRMEDENLIKNLDYFFGNLTLSISFDFLMDY